MRYNGVRERVLKNRRLFSCKASIVRIITVTFVFLCCLSLERYFG